MKRIILLGAILAVAASCSKNEVVVNTPKTNEIAFSTLNDRVTKSANDSHSDYKVYAVQTGITTAWYIDDYVVGADATTAIAPFGGPHYWPTDDSKLSFYAYAPNASANITPTVTPATAIKLAYVVPSSANEDFTVATPVTGATSTDNNGGTNTSDQGGVDLKFNHMLAKVTVLVKLDEKFAVNYVISDGDDFEDATSTLELYVDQYPGDKPFTATFTPKFDSFTVNAFDVTSTTATASAALAAQATGEEVYYAGATTYMIAPQPFAGCQLQINGITVRLRENGATFFPGGVGVNLSTIELKGNELNGEEAVLTDAFAAGTHYTFTVTISGLSTEEDEDPAVEIKIGADKEAWGSGSATLEQK